jgi:hypothetical protein
MSMPVGKKWNIGDSYMRIIQPDQLTKAGTIIRPLKFRKDPSMSTNEKLVAQREMEGSEGLR